MKNNLIRIENYIINNKKYNLLFDNKNDQIWFLILKLLKAKNTKNYINTKNLNKVLIEKFQSLKSDNDKIFHEFLIFRQKLINFEKHPIIEINSVLKPNIEINSIFKNLLLEKEYFFSLMLFQNLKENNYQMPSSFFSNIFLVLLKMKYSDHYKIFFDIKYNCLIKILDQFKNKNVVKLFLSNDFSKKLIINWSLILLSNKDTINFKYLVLEIGSSFLAENVYLLSNYMSKNENVLKLAINIFIVEKHLTYASILLESTINYHGENYENFIFEGKINNLLKKYSELENTYQRFNQYIKDKKGTIELQDEYIFFPILKSKSKRLTILDKIIRIIKFQKNEHLQLIWYLCFYGKHKSNQYLLSNIKNKNLTIFHKEIISSILKLVNNGPLTYEDFGQQHKLTYAVNENQLNYFAFVFEEDPIRFLLLSDNIENIDEKANFLIKFSYILQSKKNFVATTLVLENVLLIRPKNIYMKLRLIENLINSNNLRLENKAKKITKQINIKELNNSQLFTLSSIYFKLRFQHLFKEIIKKIDFNLLKENEKSVFIQRLLYVNIFPHKDFLDKVFFVKKNQISKAIVVDPGYNFEMGHHENNNIFCSKLLEKYYKKPTLLTSLYSDISKDIYKLYKVNKELLTRPYAFDNKMDWTKDDILNLNRSFQKDLSNSIDENNLPNLIFFHSMRFNLILGFYNWIKTLKPKNKINLVLGIIEVDYIEKFKFNSWISQMISYSLHSINLLDYVNNFFYVETNAGFTNLNNPDKYTLNKIPYLASSMGKQKQKNINREIKTIGFLGGTRLSKGIKFLINFLKDYKSKKLNWIIQIDFNKLIKIDENLYFDAIKLQKRSDIKIIYGKMSNNEYSNTFSKIDAVILPYLNRYNVSGSGILWEAINNNKYIFINERINLVDEINKEYKNFETFTVFENASLKNKLKKFEEIKHTKSNHKFNQIHLIEKFLSDNSKIY